MPNTITTTQNRSVRARRLLSLGLALVLIFALAIAPAAAPAAPATDAFSTIGTKLEGLIKNVYNLMLKLTLPAAVVALAWAGIKMLMGGQRNMEEAKKSVFVVLIVVLIVWLAPTIIKELASAFGGNANTWDFTGVTPTIS